MQQQCNDYRYARRYKLYGTLATIASSDKWLNSLTKLFELYYGRNRLELGQVDYM